MSEDLSIPYTRVTILVPDNTVYLDQYSTNNVDLNGIASNIRCIQWYENLGTIEFNDGLDNITIDSIQPYIKYIQQAEIVINQHIEASKPSVALEWNRIEGIVWNHLDIAAKFYDYSSIMHAVSYVNSSNSKFAAEGRAFSDWRDQVWLTYYNWLSTKNLEDFPASEDDHELELILPVFNLE